MSAVEKAPAKGSSAAASKRFKSLLDRGCVVVVAGRPLRTETPRVVLVDEADPFDYQRPAITTRG